MKPAKCLRQRISQNYFKQSTILTKSSISYVWQDPDYAYEISYNEVL